MNSNQIAAYKTLEQAQQALKSGDKDTARQLAAQAAQLAPELEEVWLLLAALASPRGSVEYLEKALQINPGSERAKKGMAWALGRIKHEEEAAAMLALTREPAEEQVVIPPVKREPAEQPPSEKESSVAVSDAEEPELEPDALDDTSPITEAAPVLVSSLQKNGAATRSRTSYITVLFVLVCLILAWLGWRGVGPAADFLISTVFNSQDSGPAWAEANIAKADLNINRPIIAVTPQPTVMGLEATAGPSSGLSTLTPIPFSSETLAPIVTVESPSETAVPPTDIPPLPTDTLPAPTATQTASATPLPTDTLPAPTATQITASATPLPTDTQPVPAATVEIPSATIAPTFTLLPTDVVLPSATLQSQASPTPLPTDTAEPGPTRIVIPTPKPGGGSVTGRWIDVDLTNQRVYAYEGNSVVNSFIVSTGTWEYPTVTGQYKVYVKYRYADMSGPGYYLPNVPFTMYFYKGYAIHGTYWHNNFGTPMSHGCVNFSISDAEWIYNFSSVGTLVNVHY